MGRRKIRNIEREQKREKKKTDRRKIKWRELWAGLKINRKWPPHRLTSGVKMNTLGTL